MPEPSVRFGGFNPDLHPHGEHGRWASSSATSIDGTGSDSLSGKPDGTRSNTQFPADADLAALKVVKQLGGSTGAKLVQGADGTKYVMKRGANPDHIREEFACDSVYRALGFTVQDSKLYETPTGPVKLARYLDDVTPLGSAMAKATPEKSAEMVAKIRKGFAADALLGNWDVIGMQYDNIMVTPTGDPVRIDNGGSLRFRAQGERKSPSQWTTVADEVNTMRGIGRGSRTAASIYGGMTDGEIGEQVKELVTKRSVILAAVPQEIRSTVDGRLKWMADKYGVTGDPTSSPAGFYAGRDLHAEGEWPEPPLTPGKGTTARHAKKAYGGVMFDDAGRVLLREPKNHFGGYCVPLDTKILTRTGWKSHSEVVVGDETIGFDVTSGSSRWTRITAVHHFQNQPLVRYGNQKLFSVQCTPNHRWLTVTRHESGPQWDMIEASQPMRLHSGNQPAQKLKLAAPHIDEGTSDITPDEAALLAWIVTDGSMSPVKATAWECSVTQLKPHGIEAIDALLARMKFPHSKTVDYGDMAHYRLQAHGLRKLLDRTGYMGDKGALTGIVLSLSSTAVRAFLEAAYLAEGSDPHKSARTRNCMWQNAGPCTEALQIAAYRAGWFPAIRKTGKTKLQKISMMQSEIRDIWAEPSDPADVWCVTTDLGTWTMRQGAYVCLTGNSWTFAKGGAEPGEHPSDVALREVKEETGHTAKIVGHVPGVHSSGPGSAAYFYLMKSVGSNPAHMDDETSQVRWATPDEARALISQSEYPGGRARDLRLLDAAVRANATTVGQAKLSRDSESRDSVYWSTVVVFDGRHVDRMTLLRCLDSTPGMTEPVALAILDSSVAG